MGSLGDWQELLVLGEHDLACGWGLLLLLLPNPRVLNPDLLEFLVAVNSLADVLSDSHLIIFGLPPLFIYQLLTIALKFFGYGAVCWPFRFALFVLLQLLSQRLLIRWMVYPSLFSPLYGPHVG